MGLWKQGYQAAQWQSSQEGLRGRGRGSRGRGVSVYYFAYLYQFRTI